MLYLKDQHCTENPIYVFPEIKLRDLVPNSYIHVSVSDLYIPRIGMPVLLQADQSWEYINCSQIHECGNWETEHYNSVLEITWPRSFISGNTKNRKPDIYIGFSMAFICSER
jgi:hypothetical protein